jgi:fibronectin type 3 domain-containing protein
MNNSSPQKSRSVPFLPGVIAGIVLLLAADDLPCQTDPPPAAPTGLKGTAVTGNRDSFDGAGPASLPVHDAHWKSPGTVGSVTYSASNFQIRNNVAEVAAASRYAAAYYENGQSASQECQIVDKAHSVRTKYAAVRMGPGGLGYGVYLTPSSISSGAYTRVNLMRGVSWISTIGSGTWPTSSDHVLRIRVTGTSPVTIETWVDGVKLTNYTDSSTSRITTGFPGFWCSTNSDTVGSAWDSWTDLTPSGFRLDWTANAETDLASYSVYRSMTSGSGYSIIASGLTSPSFIDHSLAAGITYYYVVRAVDRAGNQSPYSAQVSTGGAGDLPPSAPTGVKATAIASSGNQDAFDETGPVALPTHDAHWKSPGTVGSASYSASNFQVRDSIVELVAASRHAAAYYGNGQGANQECQVVDKAHSVRTKYAAVRMGPGSLGYGVYLTPSSISSGAYTRVNLMRGASWISTIGSGTWPTSSDHVLRIRVTGTSPVTIETWVDGVKLTNYTDSSTSRLTTGFPGFWCSTTADTIGSTFDSWTDAPGSTGGIRIEWARNLETDIASYRVYRSTRSGSGYTLLASNLTSLLYNDTSAVNGTPYYYVVAAVDKAGGVSSYSAEGRATAGGTVTPRTIAWTAPRFNEDGTTLTDLAGYKVYRGTTSGTYGTVVDVGFTTQYALPVLARGTYYFRATAYDEVGNESDYSNELVYTAP